MSEIITRILGLRAKFGTQNRILPHTIDAKSGFQQVRVAPDRAAAFANRLRKLVFLDSDYTSGGAGARRGGGCSMRNTGNSSDDGIAVGGYIGGEPIMR